MEFEWDPEKAARNYKKHGVAFAEAATVGRSVRGWLLLVALREELMKNSQDERTNELWPEYDMRELLRTGVQGKYAELYKAGTNLVLLEQDVIELTKIPAKK